MAFTVIIRTSISHHLNSRVTGFSAQTRTGPGCHETYIYLQIRRELPEMLHNITELFNAQYNRLRRIWVDVDLGEIDRILRFQFVFKCLLMNLSKHISLYLTRVDNKLMDSIQQTLMNIT